MKSDSIGQWTDAPWMAAIDKIKNAQEACAISITSVGGATETLARYVDEQRGLLKSVSFQDHWTNVGRGWDRVTRMGMEVSEAMERIASSTRSFEEAFQKVRNSITFAESVTVSIPPTWSPLFPPSIRHEEQTPTLSVLNAVADSMTSVAKMLGTSINTADAHVSLANGQTIGVEIRNEGDRTLVTVKGSEAGDGS